MIKETIASLLLLSAIVCQAKTSEVSFVKGPNKEAKNINYAGNRAPLAPAAFIKLPLGVIKPQGWIGEVLVRQQNGLAGNLGSISAWLTKKR